MSQRPIRIAFVVRSFTFGGAEHDIIQLMTESDPRELCVVGMAVQTQFPLCPDLPLDHPRVPSIYQPGATQRHPKIISKLCFAAAVRRLSGQAEILIAWGVPDLADVVPAHFRGRIVVTSKASGAYQESFLHANALLTSDYVANSVKSIEAFPAPLRGRVRVIYPGVQARRVRTTLDRDLQRSAWGISPDELVAGYLGRIAPDKGVEKLVEAVRALDPRWKAVFVGRNGNFPDYERAFARLCRERLPGRHRIVDWTTGIGNALSAFDVLAYPTEEEGFSNSLAEAWLLGVPTVATSGVGALAEEQWASCSVRVPAGFTPKRLSRALETACRNQRLVSRARRAAQSLTVPATIARWSEYLRELAELRRAPRVMALLPNALIGGIPSWLATLMRHTPLLDWACLCIMSEADEHAADAKVLEEIMDRGCPVVGIPATSPAQTRARLRRAIRQTRPDVIVHCGVRDLDATFPRTRVPLVAISHGPERCQWARDVLSNSTRSAARHAAISATAAAAYPARLRRSVRVIPNGVEAPPGSALAPRARRRARRRMGLSEREIGVGYVGRLSPEKDPVSVARAVEALPRRFRGVFIGPDYDGTLEEIGRATSRFIHVPPVAPREVSSLLPGLDVLVCPSHYESFGLAIVEAWACRVPVVSTRVGVVAELIDECDVAVTVPVNPSAAVLAAAIVRAVRERDRRVDACRSLVESRFTAERMGREWQDYLKAAVEQPRRARDKLRPAGIVKRMSAAQHSAVTSPRR